jgi:hypothetical protein
VSELHEAAVTVNANEPTSALGLTPQPTVVEQDTPPAAAPKHTFYERIERFISQLSVRNNFWHRVCSFVWLPFAFYSGIKMRLMGTDASVAVLPFTRINRNWYNAMAGAALLGNSEVAGGMYVFGIVGAEYTVVCKHLEYRFLRPCRGPAIYRITPRGDIKALVATGGEFNIVLDLDICQQLYEPRGSEARVGKCVATFHVTPKSHHRARAARRR